MQNFINKINLLDKYEKLLILIGFLGLFPFIIGLFDLLINKKNLFFLINIPKYYGSIILAFLGGIYWGVTLNLIKKNILPYQTNFFIIIWSVIPSTIAIIVLSSQSSYSILLLSLGFLLCQLVDEIYYKHCLFPFWYLPFRRALSLVVIIVLISSFFIISKNSLILHENVSI